MGASCTQEFSSLVTICESNLFSGPGKEHAAVLRLHSTVPLAVCDKANCIRGEGLCMVLLRNIFCSGGRSRRCFVGSMQIRPWYTCKWIWGSQCAGKYAQVTTLPAIPQGVKLSCALAVMELEV